MDFTSAQTFVTSLQTISMVAASVIGFVGVLIMCYGTLKGLIFFIIYTKRKYELMTEIRIDVAKHLSLGLEFLVGKDIIETIIRPTVDQLIVLAFIVAIRSVLILILSWEMKNAGREMEEEKKIEEQLQAYESKRLKQEQSEG